MNREGLVHRVGATAASGRRVNDRCGGEDGGDGVRVDKVLAGDIAANKSNEVMGESGSDKAVASPVAPACSNVGKRVSVSSIFGAVTACALHSGGPRKRGAHNGWP